MRLSIARPQPNAKANPPDHPIALLSPLQVALTLGKDALTKAFEQYDSNRSGQLDIEEFGKACAVLGFGAAKSEIFQALDANGSGVLTYKELIDGLMHDIGQVPSSAKAMLQALVLSTITPSHEGTASASTAIDTSTWVIKGQTIESVRTELQRLMNESGAMVADLIRVFDEDANATEVQIDDVEFDHGMRRFGYKGRPQVLKEIFKSMDSDGSGQVGFDELYEFIHGKRHSLDPRDRVKLDMKLEPPDGYDLEDLVWDGIDGVRALRVMLMAMLLRCKAAPTHLLRELTNVSKQQRGSARKGIDRKEFVQHMHDCFFSHADPEFWDDEVFPAVCNTYDEMYKIIKGENFLKLLRVAHFEMWLTINEDERCEMVALVGVTHVKELTRRVVERNLTTLRIKTRYEKLVQARRRQAIAREREGKKKVRIDWVEKARVQVAAFCMMPPERAIAPSTLPTKRAVPHTPHDVIQEWRNMPAELKKLTVSSPKSARMRRRAPRSAALRLSSSRILPNTPMHTNLHLRQPNFLAVPQPATAMSGPVETKRATLELLEAENERLRQIISRKAHIRRDRELR